MYAGGMSDLQLRFHATECFGPRELSALRRMLRDSFRSFSEEDWLHACGGLHVWVEANGRPISHAACVTRTLQLGADRYEVGYIEAVATLKEFRREGHASRVMRQLGELLHAARKLAALSTHAHGFYERLGWERWRGPSAVLAPEGPRPTPADDGDIMVLRTRATPLELDLDLPIACDWRIGDVW